jgi:glycine dehydrogenase subunit 2
MYELQDMLQRVSGMDACTLTPAAGAHGEFSGVKTIVAWHQAQGHDKRKVMLIPDSAHGTNPATSAMSGLVVKPVPTDARGNIDLEKLAPLCNDELAGIMITNPNTLGLFEKEIVEIASLVHACGGLLYYDGANMNPMLGVVRPGDMGFDIMHLNLHKTFSTPHGGGGPGSGPVGVAARLAEIIPVPKVVRQADGTFQVVGASEKTAGQVSGFLGNFGIILRAYAYILALGKENIKLAGKLSVLGANYIKESLKDAYKLPIPTVCKHEFVFDGLINDGAHDEVHGATTLDVAKRLLDFGFHAPTIYFPLLFHQAIMIEPTETESKETMDAFIEVMHKIAAEAAQDPTILQEAPHTTPVRRPDETRAARQPILKFGDASA